MANVTFPQSAAEVDQFFKAHGVHTMEDLRKFLAIHPEIFRESAFRDYFDHDCETRLAIEEMTATPSHGYKGR